MKTTATTTTNAADRGLNRSDLAILSAAARFHHLTAAQVNRLVFPGCHDELRYARRRLARLVDAGLLLRLRPLALPHRGAAPHVFTLTKSGRRLLGLPGVYLRPSEEQSKARNLPFIAHTLATIDVLIAASCCAGPRRCRCPGCWSSGSSKPGRAGFRWAAPMASRSGRWR